MMQYVMMPINMQNVTPMSMPVMAQGLAGTQPQVQECNGPTIKRRKAQLKGLVDSNQSAAFFQTPQMAQSAAQAAAAEAENRHRAKHEAERAATAQAVAQVDAMRRQHDTVMQQLKDQTARTVAAEAAVEVEKVKVVEAVESAAKLEAELRNPRAARKAEVEQLKAVHEATLFSKVESEVAERIAGFKKASKAAERRAAKAAKDHAAALKAAEERTLEVGLMAQAALAEQKQQAEQQLTTLNRSIGQYKARLEPLLAAEAKRAEAAAQSGIARIKAANVASELQAGRENDAELRRELATARAERDAFETELDALKKSSAKLISPRTSGSPDAPLTARTLEYLRRICEETNCSFHGASTAIALVLGLFLEGGPTEAQLISNAAIKAAFERLGMVDEDRERVLNSISKQYWSMGADGGNKGRAMEMMAYCIWDEVKGKPVVKPLAASDLNANQTAANGTATHLRAVEHLDLQPEYCTAFSTDGTSHALQDAEDTLSSLHQKAVAVAKAVEDEMKAAVANCCIHGKALEENGGLEAMCRSAEKGGGDGLRKLVWKPSLKCSRWCQQRDDLQPASLTRPSYSCHRSAAGTDAGLSMDQKGLFDGVLVDDA